MDHRRHRVLVHVSALGDQQVITARIGATDLGHSRVVHQSGNRAVVTALGVEQPRSIRFATVGEDLHSVSDAHLYAGADSLGMRVWRGAVRAPTATTEPCSVMKARPCGRLGVCLPARATQVRRRHGTEARRGVKAGLRPCPERLLARDSSSASLCEEAASD